MATFYVTVDVQTAANLVSDEILNGSVTGEMIDCYGIQTDDAHGVIVQVFEKHYYRAGNRLTLTVTIDNLQGKTVVHTVGGGGGEGFFRFDWGAAESFEEVAQKALKPYIVPCHDL